MSDTSNDTSVIDDKKNENAQTSSSTFYENVVSFLSSLITFIVIILLYFSSSGIILYISKLAQSNILPTEEHCYPYTNAKPDIQNIKTNIFINTSTDPEMSMKMEFPYDKYNSTNKILDMFREYREKPNSHFLGNYFISIVEKLTLFNYTTINTIMGFFNDIPETLVVGFGPIIVGFLTALIAIVNFIYFIALWIISMSWFFKKNTNDNNSGKPKWEDVGFTSPVDFGIGVLFVILFIVLLALGFGFLYFVPFIIAGYCWVSCLLYKSTLNDKKSSAFNIIKELLKYYKITIVSIISFIVVYLSFSKLGNIPGLFSILTLALVYWGVISIDIFKPIPETNLTPLVSNNPAIKKCSFVPPKQPEHGFLYDMLIGGNQKGGGLIKQLKKIKKMSNIS